MTADPSTPKSRSVGSYLALGIFLLALAIRLCGIGWGLKNDLHNSSYHPDEPVIFANSRAIEPGLGQFVPERPVPMFYSYGTLYLSLLRIASDVTTTYTGAPSSPRVANAEKTDWGWVSRCHLAGRIISCFAGAGTALFVVLILLPRVGSVAAGFAGGLLAIAPAHVLHSRFQTVDILASFFLAVSLFYSAKIAYFDPETSLPEGSKKKKPTSLLKLSLLAGAFAGLSAGTKYTGIIAIASLVVALFLNSKKKFIVPAIAGVVLAIVLFVATTPGVVLQTDAFMSDFAYEMQHTSVGHGLVFTGTSNGFVYTFTNLLFGIGPLLALIGLAGLLYAAYRKHRWAWVMLAFFLPYYFLIGRSEVKFVRYSFPLYVEIACGFGYAMQMCHRRGGWSRAGVGLGIIGLGGLPFGGLVTTLAYTGSMMGEDPRDSAAKYLQSNPGPVGLAHNPWFWTPAFFKDAEDPLSVPTPIKLALAQQQSKPPIAVVLNDDQTVVLGWNSDLITKQKPPLISFSSFEYFPVLRVQDRKDLGEQQPEVDSANDFLKALKSGYQLDQMFGAPILGGNHPEMLPEDLFYTDPVIYVWKAK